MIRDLHTHSATEFLGTIPTIPEPVKQQVDLYRAMLKEQLMMNLHTQPKSLQTLKQQLLDEHETATHPFIDQAYELVKHELTTWQDW